MLRPPQELLGYSAVGEFHTVEQPLPFAPPGSPRRSARLELVARIVRVYVSSVLYYKYTRYSPAPPELSTRQFRLQAVRKFVLQEQVRRAGWRARTNGYDDA